MNDLHYDDGSLRRAIDEHAAAVTEWAAVRDDEPKNPYGTNRLARRRLAAEQRQERRRAARLRRRHAA